MTPGMHIAIKINLDLPNGEEEGNPVVVRTLRHLANLFENEGYLDVGCLDLFRDPGGSMMRPIGEYEVKAGRVLLGQ